jgi:hypothetical protein
MRERSMRATWKKPRGESAQFILLAVSRNSSGTVLSRRCYMDKPAMSFSAATETSKLLITLSTGVIAFCVTLVNVEQTKATSLTPITTGQKGLLASSWLLLLFCAAAGVWVQLAITHVLSNTDTVTIWDTKIRVPYKIQIGTFLVGMLCLVGYGGWRVFS